MADELEYKNERLPLIEKKKITHLLDRVLKQKNFIDELEKLKSGKLDSKDNDKDRNQEEESAKRKEEERNKAKTLL